MNPGSLTVITNAKLEPSLAEAEPEFRCQFERLGYFVADRRDPIYQANAPSSTAPWPLRTPGPKSKNNLLSFHPLYGQPTSILHR